jgi:hypothetical protein
MNATGSKVFLCSKSSVHEAFKANPKTAPTGKLVGVLLGVNYLESFPGFCR